MNTTEIPILRSSAVLRPEYFGGLVFNRYIPPELRLDTLRFKVATLCDGDHAMRDIYEIIESETLHSNAYAVRIVDQTIDQLEKQRLLYWREKKQEQTSAAGQDRSPDTDGNHLSAPLAVIWEITRMCNLRCRHCFSDSGNRASGELSTEEMMRIVDQLADNKVLYVNLTGGEPLLRQDLFTILDYASQQKIYFDLSSNGCLITSELVGKLADTTIFQVQLSLDGLKATHDQIRGVPGAFDKTTAAAAELVRQNFRVAISTTINRKNYHQLTDLVDLAIDLGASTFKTTLFIPTGRGRDNKADLSLTPHQVKAVSFEIMQKEKATQGRITILKEGFYPWLMESSAAQEADWIRERNVGCAAGQSSIFITATGDVLPCPFLRDFNIGNLRDRTLRDIWQSERWDLFRGLGLESLKGACGNCEKLGDGCNGGCRAAALAYDDDILAADPFCWKNI